MALIVVEMGRRVITPQNNKRRGTIKTQATKNSAAIDQYHQSTSDALIPQADSISIGQGDDPYSVMKQRRAQQNPSRVSLLAEIMTNQTITLSADANVNDAWQLFQQHGFHHIPIIDENNIVLAMLSERDILQGPGVQKNISLENIMPFASSQVFCFSADTDIRQATRILYEYDLGALPIISEDHQLLGIVSRTDIIKVVSHYGPLELWA
ncbi:MAG: CBS domain-containing protein [Oleispira sp.]